jgi:hypothetical protein
MNQRTLDGQTYVKLGPHREWGFTTDDGWVEWHQALARGITS